MMYTDPTPYEKPAQPSQVTYPGRAVLRTVVAVLVVALPTYAIVVPMVLDSMGDWIPPGAQHWLLGSVVFVVALTGLVTRLMAVPGINKVLTILGLGAEPRGF